MVPHLNLALAAQEIPAEAPSTNLAAHHTTVTPHLSFRLTQVLLARKMIFWTQRIFNLPMGHRKTAVKGILGLMRQVLGGPTTQPWMVSMLDLFWLERLIQFI